MKVLLQRTGHSRLRRWKPPAHARPLRPKSGQTGSHLAKTALCRKETFALQQKDRSLAELPQNARGPSFSRGAGYFHR
jgi:hypothetical protein